MSRDSNRREVPKCDPLHRHSVATSRIRYALGNGGVQFGLTNTDGQRAKGNSLVQVPLSSVVSGSYPQRRSSPHTDSHQPTTAAPGSMQSARQQESQRPHRRASTAHSSGATRAASLNRALSGSKIAGLAFGDRQVRRRLDVEQVADQNHVGARWRAGRQHSAERRDPPRAFGSAGRLRERRQVPGRGGAPEGQLRGMHRPALVAGQHLTDGNL